MWGNVTWGTVMQGTTTPPYGFRSNLVCLSKPVKLTDNNQKTLAYYTIIQFSIHY